MESGRSLLLVYASSVPRSNTSSSCASGSKQPTNEGTSNETTRHSQMCLRVYARISDLRSQTRPSCNAAKRQRTPLLNENGTLTSRAQPPRKLSREKPVGEKHWWQGHLRPESQDVCCQPRQMLSPGGGLGRWSMLPERIHPLRTLSKKLVGFPV